MNRILLMLVGAGFGLLANAQVTYQTIPLPKQVEVAPGGQVALLIKGQPVTYPQGNEVMKRNAQFAAEYFSLTACEASKKVKAGLQLTLGLKSSNPEAYAIRIDKKGISIQGASESGVFYGLQTLRKSLSGEQGDTLRLPYATITDEPRFAYRGTELDCARHFFPVAFIKKFIDILALHGVNRFHWHLTDDQGWRFEMKSLPELAAKASVRPHTIIGKNLGLNDSANALYDDTPETGYYSQEEMKEIVRYAAERFITVIPEIDLPGHMVAALSVYPELGCTGGPYEVWTQWGISADVLCAGNPKTLDFLHKVMDEVCEVFPGKLIHIGGDESPRTRWKSCSKCQAKMKELGLKNEAQLQTYINKDIEAYLSAKGRDIIGWDETLEGGLSDKASVMSWRGYQGGIEAARQHHHVVMTPTSHCYIDYYQLKDPARQPLAIGGYLPLNKVYSMEPVPAELTEEESKYIMGAQCNLWTEYVVSPDHAMYMLLPRLAAMCEVQWMQPEAKNYDDFSQNRLPALQALYRQLGYKYCPAFE